LEALSTALALLTLFSPLSLLSLSSLSFSFLLSSLLSSFLLFFYYSIINPKKLPFDSIILLVTEYRLAMRSQRKVVIHDVSIK
jgi:hypothetical protein